MNIQQMMKQAQAMQKKVAAMQEEQGNKIYEGKAGGNMVAIELNGKHEVKKINIDKTAIDPEDKEMLEDLVMAAFNDAKAKIDEDSENAMQGIMPAGFKMPF